MRFLAFLYLKAVLVFTLSSLPIIELVAAPDDSPISVKGAVTIDVDEAKKLFDKGAYFIDVRRETDWSAGRIPGAIHLDVNTRLTRISLLEETKSLDAPVVFYCNGIKCPRSSQASIRSVGWGFSTVYYFRLGFPAWKAAGFGFE